MSFDRLRERHAAPAETRSGRSGARRLGLLGLVFLASMAAVGLRMADLAMKKQAAVSETETAQEKSAPPPSRRLEIVDRNGLPLALTVPTYELYLDTSLLRSDADRDYAVERLAAEFEDLDEAGLREKIAKGGTRLLRRPMGPRDAQAAHDLGIPAVYTRERFDRVYPAGRRLAHVLGYVNIDGDGAAGLEAALDTRLKGGGGPGDEPVRLSVDLRVQNTLHESLSRAMKAFEAKAAAGLVMSARTGEILAMVSLPDFDPSERPDQDEIALKDDSRFFHRAAQGLYELGSTFKIFTWALAFETGIAEPDDVLPAPKSFTVSGRKIHDLHPIRKPVTVAEGFAKSSNIVAAQLALEAGAPAQRRMFKSLGLTSPVDVEVVEARAGAPRWDEHWTDATTAATAYGHGVSVTPLHLATAVATVVNRGRRVRPTLLALDAPPPDGGVVLSPRSSQLMLRLMRKVVADGSGGADVPGLGVAGKTGTGNKPDLKNGGYLQDKVVASFVAAFPSHDPQYVVLITLDEAEDRSGATPVRLASRTAAPVAGEVIARIAPILGVAPVE